MNALTFLLPVQPVVTLLSDRNKRFYALVEQPLMGIPASLAGSALARAILHFATGAPPEVFGAGYLGHACQTYFAHHSANVVRNGVNVDDTIPAPVKVRLNYYYSVLAYGVAAAADDLARLGSPGSAATALAEIAYAVLWPLLSQHVATYLVKPVLYDAFPKREHLEALHAGALSNAAFAGFVRKSGLPAWCVRWQIGLVERVRRDLPEGAPTPPARRVAYWIAKTGASTSISVCMIAVYFLLRFALVGLGDTLGPLVRIAGWVVANSGLGGFDGS